VVPAEILDQQKNLSASSRKILKERKPTVSTPKLEWAEKGEAEEDLLRAAHLPLLPSDESHVDADLKRIHKGKALAPALLVRGDIASGLPLIVADGYHRICAVFRRERTCSLPDSGNR
jgi:hypothetical protein